MINTREIALEILNKTISDEAYANLLMRTELNKIPPINRPFVSEMVYGVLRNYYLLEYQVKDEINEKTKLNLKLLILMALYEKYFLKTKEYALVNEYVELAGNRYDKSFVNAVLRNTKELTYAEGDNALSINSSLPLWIARLLSKQYDEEKLNQILEVYSSKAKTYYRINHRKCGINDLNKPGINRINDDFFTSDVPLLNTLEFRKGMFYVQDINSACITDNLELNNDSLFLDMCSAPGSKLFNVLEKVKEENCYANDLHSHRVELIKKRANQLGYSKVHYFNCDATKLPETTDKRFDRILLDAPCSGLGVISRRPDIKFHIRPESLDELEKLQHDLLESAYLLLKDKGIMVYSTCTVNRKENDKQIAHFISSHPDMKLMKEETVIKKGGDLFYFAKMIKE